MHAKRRKERFNSASLFIDRPSHWSSLQKLQRQVSTNTHMDTLTVLFLSSHTASSSSILLIIRPFIKVLPRNKLFQTGKPQNRDETIICIPMQAALPRCTLQSSFETHMKSQQFLFQDEQREKQLSISSVAVERSKNLRISTTFILGKQMLMMYFLFPI